MRHFTRALAPLTALLLLALTAGQAQALSDYREVHSRHVKITNLTMWAADFHLTTSYRPTSGSRGVWVDSFTVGATGDAKHAIDRVYDGYWLECRTGTLHCSSERTIHEHRFATHGSHWNATFPANLGVVKSNEMTVTFNVMLGVVGGGDRRAVFTYHLCRNGRC